jgi:hypothetical protein
MSKGPSVGARAGSADARATTIKAVQISTVTKAASKPMVLGASRGTGLGQVEVDIGGMS